MNVPCFVSPVIPGWIYGLFPHLTILNDAAVNIVVQMFKFLFSVLLGIYTEVELLDMVILCLIFFYVFHGGCTIIHFTSIAESSNLKYFLKFFELPVRKVNTVLW